MLKRGYKQLLLGREIKNGEYYLSKFEELVDKCVLGIIVLDGLRPNVVFELGFLKGRNKPIIVLKSQKAYINIENLYKDPGILTKIKLKIKKSINPSLDVNKHFSDWGGKHISNFRIGSSKKHEDHISNVIKAELEKMTYEISEETKKVNGGA
jgi:nucleoside 2-deoxyribosyltransferase